MTTSPTPAASGASPTPPNAATGKSGDAASHPAQPESPALTDTVTLKRRDRRDSHAREQVQKLPKVPEHLAGRVLCAHPEIITALAALGMSLIFILPPNFLTVAALIAVLGFAYGWGHLVHLPSVRAAFILISLVGVTAVVSGWFFSDFSIIAEVVGFGVLGAFLTEMFRHPRPDLLHSVSGNMTGVLIVSTAGAWVILEDKSVWYFMLIPGALTLLGGCVGMAMSANWSPRWRAVAAIVMSTIFGLAAGGAVMVFQGPLRQQMVLFTGGHLPTLATALVSGMLLGAVVGMSFAALSILFSEDLAPLTVGAAVSEAFIPVLAASIPIYILARLLVGEGPTLT